MSRSKQRSHCQHSCSMCDHQKREPGVAKPGDRRRMQKGSDDVDLRAPVVVTRGEHRHDRTGFCPRCALPVGVNGGQCPPGYWMTPTELAVWQDASIKARHEMERRIGVQPRFTTAQADQPK